MNSENKLRVLTFWKAVVMDQANMRWHFSRKEIQAQNCLKQSSLGYQAVRGVLWMAFSAGLIYAIRVTTLMVLARLLSPKDFGTVAAAMVVVGFVATFRDLGISQALVQLHHLESVHIRTGFVLALFLGLSFTLTIWVVAPFVEQFFRIANLTPVLQTLSLTFFLAGVSVVSRALLRREMRFRTLAILEGLSYAVGYAGVGIPLAALGFGVWALVGAHLVEVAVSSIGVLILRPHDFRPTIDGRAISQLLNFGGGYTLARIANYFSTQVDKLFVGRWMGAYSLGIYSRAYYFVGTAITFAESTIGRVFFSAASQIQQDRDRLVLGYLYAISFISAIFCPMVAVSIVTAPELVSVLLGRQWSEVANPFRILAFGILAGMLYEVSHYLSMAKGAVYPLAAIQAFYLFLIITGAWIGRQWGVTGVAGGVLVAMVVNSFLVVTLSLRLIKIAWYTMLRALMPAAISGSVLGLWAYGMSQILRHFNSPDIVILIVIGLSCLFIWFLLWRINPEFFFGSLGSEAMSRFISMIPSWMQALRVILIGRKLSRIQL